MNNNNKHRLVAILFYYGCNQLFYSSTLMDTCGLLILLYFYAVNKMIALTCNNVIKWNR